MTTKQKAATVGVAATTEQLNRHNYSTFVLSCHSTFTADDFDKYAGYSDTKLEEFISDPIKFSDSVELCYWVLTNRERLVEHVKNLSADVPPAGDARNTPEPSLEEICRQAVIAESVEDNREKQAHWDAYTAKIEERDALKSDEERTAKRTARADWEREQEALLNRAGGGYTRTPTPTPTVEASATPSPHFDTPTPTLQSEAVGVGGVVTSATPIPTLHMVEVLAPGLPALAHLPGATATGACQWLDDYIEFSGLWSPRAFAGFHEGVGLWLLSTIAARRVYADHGDEEYTALYIAMVATSTLFAKSTTAKIALETLEVTNLSFLLTNDDQTPQLLQKSLTGKLTGDVTPEAQLQAPFPAQRGWFYEEFGGQLEAMLRVGGGPMTGFRTMLRKFYDCPERHRYGTITRGVEDVKKPYLSLLAICTQADMRKAGARGNRLWSDGFLARFALICTPTNAQSGRQPFPVGKRVIPSALAKPLLEWHARLGLPTSKQTFNENGDVTGYEVTAESKNGVAFGPGVLEARNNYDNALKDICDAGLPDDLVSSYGRFPQKALRIAILLASLSNNGRLELRHWARAQQITERWREGLHSTYTQVNAPSESKTMEEEERILKHLKTLYKRTRIPQTVSKIRNTARMDLSTVTKHLSAMAHNGIIICEDDNAKLKRYKPND